MTWDHNVNISDGDRRCESKQPWTASLSPAIAGTFCMHLKMFFLFFFNKNVTVVYYFAIICPWRWKWPFFTKFYLFNPVILFAKFAWNQPFVCGKEAFYLWKFVTCKFYNLVYISHWRKCEHSWPLPSHWNTLNQN